VITKSFTPKRSKEELAALTDKEILLEIVHLYPGGSKFQIQLSMNKYYNKRKIETENLARIMDELFQAGEVTIKKFPPINIRDDGICYYDKDHEYTVEEEDSDEENINDDGKDQKKEEETLSAPYQESNLVSRKRPLEDKTSTTTEESLPKKKKNNIGELKATTIEQRKE